MTEHLILGIACVLLLGMAAQWLAWRLHLPSILLLLTFGFLAGPVFHLLDVNELMGDLLFPVVSISVALILFEGGLSLRLHEVREVRRAVRNLIFLGAVITWFTATAGAYFLLGLDLGLSVLLGAILVVTGPTVVIPLLRHVRPTPRVGSVAKWEGIIIDPVGATLSVLVFEALLAGSLGSATGHAVEGFVLTVVVGVLLGAAGALIIGVLLRYHWIPDFLQNPVTLSIVVGVFTLSNLAQEESGLLTVTLMGILLANQKKVAVKHIIEFKENLRVLLISGLFILLSARLELSELRDLTLGSLAFVLLLIVAVRPLSVFLSTAGTTLNTKEKIFLSWMAPRGIVAAAVASIFSLKLVSAGIEGAERLVPITFLIIVATVALYGLTAKPLARWLGLAQRHPQGFLIMGGHFWARKIAEALHAQGFEVRVADTNWEKVRASRMAGLPTYYGSVLSEYALDEIELDGIGRLLALTPNDEANSLACLHFVEVFGRAEVYQLAPRVHKEKDEEESASHLRGRLLFGSKHTFEDLNERFGKGAVVKVTKLTEEFGIEQFRQRHGESAIPLFLIESAGSIRVFTIDRKLAPAAGQTLVSLQMPAAGEK